ncbi:peroxisomal membrane protein PEX14 [Drosophila willistoni]|uniref:peroxisomal membrane protein PEX14 n=1 Tax=Drosophila willistoni TaxID=7260 RepID=UPI001F085196|nr:peroxisomal membrane protein PEX14 [Drosophila willistoni]
MVVVVPAVDDDVLITTTTAATTATATAAQPTTTTTANTNIGNANGNIQFEATVKALTPPNTCESAETSSNNNNNNNNNYSNSHQQHHRSDKTTTTTTTRTTAIAAGTQKQQPAEKTAAAAATTTGATSVAAVSSLPVPSKSAVSQRQVDIKIDKKSNMEQATQQLTKKVLKLDLSGKNLDDYALKSPKSPIAARLPHQTSLTSSVDVEDRKTLREALYQGIFHRHRRTIFAVGSFLRMLRSRNAQYNTIRSSSEGEDIDEFLKRRSSKLLKLPHLFDR